MKLVFLEAVISIINEPVYKTALSQLIIVSSLGKETHKSGHRFSWRRRGEGDRAKLTTLSQ